MYSAHQAMPGQQPRTVAPETFLLDADAQQSLPQDSIVALQQVDNRTIPDHPLPPCRPQRPHPMLTATQSNISSSRPLSTGATTSTSVVSCCLLANTCHVCSGEFRRT